MRVINENDIKTIDDMSSQYILVTKEKGSTGFTPIDPDFIELKAAFEHIKEKMVKEMLKASELRPKSGVKMSDKELKAWKAYEDIMGDDKPKYFEYASLHEIASSAEKIVLQYAKKEKKKFDKINVDKSINSIHMLDIE
jgi:hypothetical protein